MRTVYELTFQRRCPVDDHIDEYQLIVTIDGEDMMPVEDILAAIEELPAKDYQEGLTNQLAEKLPGCRVMTIGSHSGVKTTCVV